MCATTPSPPNPKPAFLDSAAVHFSTFLADQVTAEKIVATVTFVDHQVVAFDGFRIEALPNDPGCRMIRGEGNDLNLAVVIRDDHVLRVEFEADPVPRQGLGF